MAGAQNQPSFDFLTGAELPAPSKSLRREPSAARLSTLSRPDVTNEEWRTQIHKLKYEVDSLRQEREATAIRHEDELRAAQSKAEADYKRAQAAENASHAASGRYSKAEQELRHAQEQFASEKGHLEGRLRASEDANQSLEEEIEDLKSGQSEGVRKLQYDLGEFQTKYDKLEGDLRHTTEDLQSKTVYLKKVEDGLRNCQGENDDLQNEVLRLKALTGDAETLDVIKRELREQVEHIKKLEATNLDQSIELKQLRKQHKSIDVVEEEKKMLESKLRIMVDLRRELSESQLQRQILEDERRSWTSYLENEERKDTETRFDTPEALAKAYIRSCAETAELAGKLAKMSEELSSSEARATSLEDEHRKMEEEMTKLRLSNSAGSDLKAKARLERQRALAIKEVEYLRMQLKTFDDEQSEFNPEKYDEQKTARIHELENEIDQHRKEIQQLHEELSAREDPDGNASKTNKRRRDTEEDERLGELTRKNRILQEQFSQATSAHALLEKELKATKSQLTSLKASTSTRILELRQNPTSQSQAVRSEMLQTLREENESLLARLAKSHPYLNKENESSVPTATLTRLRLELSEAKAAYTSLEKKTDRLKKVWGAKSREWRTTVAQTLGWDFDFQPHGRVRVTSTFNPGISEEEGGEGNNSIVFDGEKGTMKISGGERSAFAAGIEEDMRFWVDDKREVPCFLATLTLKFWDETTKAQRVI